MAMCEHQCKGCNKLVFNNDGRNPVVCSCGGEMLHFYDSDEIDDREGLYDDMEEVY